MFVMYSKWSKSNCWRIALVSELVLGICGTSFSPSWVAPGKCCIPNVYIAAQLCRLDEPNKFYMSWNLAASFQPVVLQQPAALEQAPPQEPPLPPPSNLSFRTLAHFSFRTWVNGTTESANTDFGTLWMVQQNLLIRILVHNEWYNRIC